MATFFLLLAGGYLVGSFPTGLVVARVLGGPDPRQAGSGNVGAANLYRLLGPRAGGLTLAGDALKGALPVLVASYSLRPLGPWQESAVAAVGLAAVLGHVWSLFLGFRGGKGVATAFGVLAVLTPWATVNLLAAYLLAVHRSRVFAVGSLMAAWLMPLAVGLFSDSKAYLLLAGIFSGLILLRHRDNLERLVRGEEPRI
ncbi:MAG: glycerol-3-phosphate 1-O-acyltransferase PlsY [Syntrophobacterales bacterium]|nr:glycerol-3-phosphate 1-O-acyltransferase PlsY [Syntrophobacterales bacterium]